ncbi:MAG: hypothetical protein H0X69_13770 [Gemmatimonadales bacterium]|nr:hypothetical protein [Gemmatimonadales bacterium]
MPEVSILPPDGSLIDVDTTFLPLAQMRQITRVTAVGESAIEGTVRLGPDHWVWAQHFPDDPVFPGTLIIEAAGQLVALWAWEQGARGRPRLVRTGAQFHNPVGRWSPGLVLAGAMRRRKHLYFGTVRVASEGTQVATVEAVLVVLPPAG